MAQYEYPWLPTLETNLPIPKFWNYMTLPEPKMNGEGDIRSESKWLTMNSPERTFGEKSG